MKKPEIFTQVLWDLAAPDMFSVSISEEESDKIFDAILRLTAQRDEFPETYLDWRDITFDAMESLGYELSEED